MASTALLLLLQPELGSFSLLYYSSNPGFSDDVDWTRLDLADFDLGDLGLLEALTLASIIPQIQDSSGILRSVDMPVRQSCGIRPW